MTSRKENVNYLVAQLEGVGMVRTRSMMGEYLLYVDDVLVGQINNDKLFIKVTPYGDTLLNDSDKVPPYPGAKPAFEIPDEKVSDSDWLTDFVRHSQEHLAKQ